MPAPSNDPIPIQEDGCSQEVFKVKNELTFYFVDTFLCKVTSYYIDWKLSIFYELFFLS